MENRLDALRDKCRALAKNGRSAAAEIKNDPVLKKEIEDVYFYYFGRQVTGCSNCLWDALIELTYTLKKATAKMKSEKFILKRGKILHDVVNQDSSLDATRDNMTDELALYHLHTNPDARQFFENVPDGLDAMLKEYGKKHEAAKLEKTRAELTGNVEADKAKTNADNVLADREANLAEREVKVLALAEKVIEFDSLEDKNSLEVEEKYNLLLALAREIVSADDDNTGDGASEEPALGTEVTLKDGTIATIRDGVGYNADGSIVKRGTYETADGGKLIVGNKGMARTEAPVIKEDAGNGSDE